MEWEKTSRVGVWCILYEPDGTSFYDFFHSLDNIELAPEYIKECKEKMCSSADRSKPVIMTCVVCYGDWYKEVHSFLLTGPEEKKERLK